jgi:hypothetical protein
MHVFSTTTPLCTCVVVPVIRATSRKQCPHTLSMVTPCVVLAPQHALFVTYALLLSITNRSRHFMWHRLRPSPLPTCGLSILQNNQAGTVLLEKASLEVAKVAHTTGRLPTTRRNTALTAGYMACSQTEPSLAPGTVVDWGHVMGVRVQVDTRAWVCRTAMQRAHQHPPSVAALQSYRSSTPCCQSASSLATTTFHPWTPRCASPRPSQMRPGMETSPSATHTSLTSRCTPAHSPLARLFGTAAECVSWLFGHLPFLCLLAL